MGVRGCIREWKAMASVQVMFRFIVISQLWLIFAFMKRSE